MNCKELISELMKQKFSPFIKIKLKDNYGKKYQITNVKLDDDGGYLEITTDEEGI